MKKFEASIAGVACVVDIESLLPESLAFLLEYGVRQYLADGAAVSKLHQSGDQKGQPKTDEQIANEKALGVQERLDNIYKGEFTRRNAQPKLSREERIRQSVVIDIIESAARKAKMKLPNRTGKNAEPDWWTEKVAAVYAKNQVAVDKEVARQIRESEKDAFEVDLG